jgi:hypothetical protein
MKNKLITMRNDHYISVDPNLHGLHVFPTYLLAIVGCSLAAAAEAREMFISRSQSRSL